MSKQQKETYSTIKIPVEYSSTEDRMLISDLQRQQTHIIRSAFKKYEKGLPVKDNLFDDYNDINLLDSWLKRSATKEGKAIYEAEKELQKTSEKKIRTCFGGKSLMNDYRSGKISKEELRSGRISPFVCIGEKLCPSKHVYCNRKFRLLDDLSGIRILMPGKKWMQVKFSARLSKNYLKIIRLLYEHQVTGDMPITYKIDAEYVYITYSVEKLYKNVKVVNRPKQIQDRVLAIDLNPNYVGWSVVDWKSHSDFHIVESGTITIKDLNDAEYALKRQHLPSSHRKRKKITNERHNEIFLVSKTLVETATHYGCSLFGYEQLAIITKDNKKGTNFNRLINNQWLRKPLINNLRKRCAESNIECLEVLCGYSSFVGNFVFRDCNLPDMCLASIEIGRRTYEYYHQYIANDFAKTKNIVFPDVNDFRERIERTMEVFNLKDSEIDLMKIYYALKRDSKMMYRVSLAACQPVVSKLLSNKIYAKKISFKKNILVQNNT